MLALRTARWARAREALATRWRRVERQHTFHVVSAAHNAAAWIARHLDSVHAQAYPRAHFRHVVIDDASDDGTDAHVLQWLERHPHHRVEYLRNSERRGGCANLTLAFRRAPPGTIVLQVDGDDWLPDPGVFEFLNRIYQDAAVWITYNSWRFPDGRPALNSEPVPQSVVSARGYRDYKWISSHLHSFRRELFEHVADDSLIDPTTGDYWHSSVDMAHYFPMLELAGRHARHVHRVTYVYNPHERSLMHASRGRQLTCEAAIRALPRYTPLRALSLPHDAAEAT